METELKIYPNGGIGKIKLGRTLHEVMNSLKDDDDDDDIEFKFNDELCFLVVYLIRKGVNLIFDSFLQRLILIEVKLDNSGCSVSPNVKFEYKNEIIKNFNFKLIYNRYMGPTCEGFYDLQKSSYFLSYCGITFKFDNVKSSHNTNEVLNTMSKELNCSAIFIYQNTEKDTNTFLWNNYTELLLNTLRHPPSINYVKDLDQFTPSICDDDKGKIKIRYSIYDCSHSGGLEIKFNKHSLGLSSFKIELGVTTLQEMTRVFGLPSDSMLKRKSRSNCIQMKKFRSKDNNDHVFEFTSSRAYLPTSMIEPRYDYEDIIESITSTSNALENFNQETVKIHNYFNFGFDVIYDLNATKNGTNVVSRIILHQNRVRSVDFLKYEKLTVFLRNQNKELVTNLKLNEIGNEVNLSGLPVFLDRKEYNIQENFESELKETDRIFEFVNIDEEEIEKENGETQVSGGRIDQDKDADSEENSKDKENENADLKYWGLTNYDGGNGAIFEALSNTGDLCTITLY